MLNHDQLFKVLLTTFFQEFLELFFPEVAAFVEPGSLVALDKELFADIPLGENYEADILMQARFKGQKTWFLIHVEPQSYQESDFEERMFGYFAMIYLRHRHPIYPIALFSYDYPLRKEPNTFNITFPNKTVLSFNYDVIQLNQLSWRDFLNRPNPVASALMAKMRISPKDRPKVKAACIRMLAGLKLNPAQKRLISGFVDSYLKLDQTETQVFKSELGKIIPKQEREAIMEIMTSWKLEGLEEGRAEGIEKGRAEGERNLALRLLRHRFGELESDLETQINALPLDKIEELSIALLDFTNRDDLLKWLETH
jgi:hypothetical protein